MQPTISLCRSRAIAITLAVGLTAGLPAGCQKPANRASTDALAAVSVPTVPLDYDLAAGLRARAAALFVDPMLDDSDPQRFTDANRVLVCADHSQVMVNGRPVVDGDLVPPGAFVMQWDMDLYCPFGTSGPLLNGRAEVLVFRDDEHGLSALLRPVSLDVLEPPLLLDDTATRSAEVDAALAAAVRAAAGR